MRIKHPIHCHKMAVFYVDMFASQTRYIAAMRQFDMDINPFHAPQGIYRTNACKASGRISKKTCGFISTRVLGREHAKFPYFLSNRRLKYTAKR